MTESSENSEKVIPWSVYQKHTKILQDRIDELTEQLYGCTRQYGTDMELTTLTVALFYLEEFRFTIKVPRYSLAMNKPLTEYLKDQLYDKLVAAFQEHLVKQIYDDCSGS